jgi:stress-induced morphogen
MSLKLEEIKNLIEEAIPDAEITIQDIAGDENHYSAIIKSKIFKGKSKIDQHKLVYKALKGKMGKELHALALNTIEV